MDVEDKNINRRPFLFKKRSKYIAIFNLECLFIF